MGPELWRRWRGVPRWRYEIKSQRLRTLLWLYPDTLTGASAQLHLAIRELMRAAGFYRLIFRLSLIRQAAEKRMRGNG